MDSSFKHNLREELNYQDLTVKELAARTNIPYPTISCYLSSRCTMPPADIAVRIAQALGVSVEYLVTGCDGNVVPHDYEAYQPFRFLLDDLKRLSPQQVETVATMIHALAERNGYRSASSSRRK